jgi:HK97 family phage major capsid protein
MQDKKAQSRSICDAIMREAGENMTQEQENKFDAAAADVDKYEGMIERQIRFEDIKRREAAEEAAAQHAKSQGTKSNGNGDPFPNAKDAPEYREVFQKVVLRGFNSLSQAEVAVFDERNTNVNLRGTAAQGTTNDGLGGFSVPKVYDTALIKVMKSFSGIMQAANIFNTSTGVDMLMAKSDQTAEKGAIIGEGNTDIVQDFSLGQVSVGSKIFTSRVIKVNKQLLTDSFLNFQAEVIDIAAMRIARYAEEVFTLGGGSITGLIPALTTGHTSALVDGVSYDDLIDLQHSVDPSYRQAPTCGYMFNDNTLKAMRKLKDSEGRPLWQPSLVAGEPNLFAGKRYFINQEMADLATGAKAIAFGDFSKYRIRVVQDRELVVLREKYALERQIGFNIFQRMDSVLIDNTAIKVMENA